MIRPCAFNRICLTDLRPLMKRSGLFCFATALAALLIGTQIHAQEVLHTEPSEFSPVVVYEALGERCMTFESVKSLGRQTCIAQDGSKRMVLNYTRMMMTSLFVQPDPQRILIIGLGGGTLPMALADLLPRARIDNVEIDPAVIRVAEAYFGFKPSDRVQVHQADGRAYVEQAVRDGKQYDLILLDAFDYTYIPKHLTTQEFLRSVKALLAPQGVLAANTFSSSDFYDQETATYASVFGRYFNLRANNRVIFAVNGELPDDATVQRNAARWTPAFQPYDIDVERELGRFSRTVKWPDGTTLLRDPPGETKAVGSDAAALEHNAEGQAAPALQ